jgi:hypothetical protein
MSGRSVRVVAVAAAVAASFAAGTKAADRVLFPTPLHLVRRLETPLTGTTTTVSEFCSGNRITSVVGEGGVVARISSVDYELQQLLEIDRVALTYSVTSFEEIAKGAPSRSDATGGAPREWVVRPRESSQSLETFEAESTTPAGKMRIEVSIDRHRTLSREAVEAITGAAYPNRESDARTLIVGAAAPRRGDRVAALSANATDYGLSVAEVVTIESEGERIVTRSTVLSIDAATVPPEILAIPQGARRVPSRLTRFAEELQRADGPPRN